MKNRKLLFFVTEDWYFCSHRLPIARAALRDGFQVVVVTRVNNHGEKIKKEGFKLIPLNINRSGKNPFREIVTFLSLVRIFKKESPHIVHNVAMKPILYGTLAARISGVPAIVNAFTGLGHIFIDKGLKTVLLRKIVELVMKYTLKKTMTIFQNPDDYDRFVEKGTISGDKACIIKGSGVDTNLFSPSKVKDDVPVIVLAARMLWTKGVGEFVEAARILKEKDVNMKMVLVGAIDPLNPASIPETTLRRWNESGVVEWWGQRDDISQIYKRSSIAVLPSYREGLPKSLIEAAAAGLPLVAFDVPGCREIVRDGENGILAPFKDAEVLACAIEKLIKSPDLRRKMGNRSREIVEKEFSEEHVVQQTMALYQDLIVVNEAGL